MFKEIKAKLETEIRNCERWHGMYESKTENNRETDVYRTSQPVPLINEGFLCRD